MATVDQKSVRDEVERIRNEFDRLSMEAKIPKESKLLFSSMLMSLNRVQKLVRAMIGDKR